MNRLDHEFVAQPSSPYCGRWIEGKPYGSPEHGFVTLDVTCGFPIDAHQRCNSEEGDHNVDLV